MGETHRSDWNGPDQLGMGLVGPSMPSSPDDFSANEAAIAWHSIASGSSGSSSVSEFLYAWILIYHYSHDPGASLRAGYTCSGKLLGE